MMATMIVMMMVMMMIMNFSSKVCLELEKPTGRKNSVRPIQVIIVMVVMVMMVVMMMVVVMVMVIVMVILLYLFTTSCVIKRLHLSFVQASATTFLGRTSWSRRWRWTGWAESATTPGDGTSWSNSAQSVSTRSLTSPQRGEGKVAESLQQNLINQMSSFVFHIHHSHFDQTETYQELHSGPDQRLPNCARSKNETVRWIPMQSCCGCPHWRGKPALYVTNQTKLSWHQIDEYYVRINRWVCSYDSEKLSRCRNFGEELQRGRRLRAKR